MFMYVVKMTLLVSMETSMLYFLDHCWRGPKSVRRSFLFGIVIPPLQGSYIHLFNEASLWIQAVWEQAPNQYVGVMKLAERDSWKDTVSSQSQTIQQCWNIGQHCGTCSAWLPLTWGLLGCMNQDICLSAIHLPAKLNDRRFIFRKGYPMVGHYGLVFSTGNHQPAWKGSHGV